MHACSALVALLLWMACSVVTSSVRAQSLAPDPEPPGAQHGSALAPPGYEEAADLGFQEFEHGNYAEARARFLQAHQIWPNARTLRALGHCEFELRHFPAAVELLRQALYASARPLTQDQRYDTEQLLSRALDRVARYTVLTSPTAARVLIDGSEGALDPTGDVTLQEGTHTIEVSAPGYVTQRRDVTVQGRIDRIVRMDLALVPPAPDPRGELVPLRRKWWLWTTVAAVAIAGGVTAIALGVRDPGVAHPTAGTNGDILVRP